MIIQKATEIVDPNNFNLPVSVVAEFNRIHDNVQDVQEVHDGYLVYGDLGCNVMLLIYREDDIIAGWVVHKDRKLQYEPEHYYVNMLYLFTDKFELNADGTHTIIKCRKMKDIFDLTDEDIMHFSSYNIDPINGKIYKSNVQLSLEEIADMFKNNETSIVKGDLTYVKGTSNNGCLKDIYCKYTSYHINLYVPSRDKVNNRYCLRLQYHRIIYCAAKLCKLSDISGLLIDHINKDTYDNRMYNLQLVNNKFNSCVEHYRRRYTLNKEYIFKTEYVLKPAYLY